MENASQIKTRADGSIDTTYYIAHGRVKRSEQAHHIAKKSISTIRPMAIAAVTVMVALTVSFVI